MNEMRLNVCDMRIHIIQISLHMHFLLVTLLYCCLLIHIFIIAYVCTDYIILKKIT